MLHPQPTAANDDASAQAAAADERDRRRGGPRTAGGGSAPIEDTVLCVKEGAHHSEYSPYTRRAVRLPVPCSMARLQQVDMTESLLNERDAAIDDIASEMVAVSDTYQRLAGMVDEQGKDLDTIETNAIDAEASTLAGVGHLTKAASYQKQYGRCILILVLILLLVAASVGGYFGYREVCLILLGHCVF